MVSQCECTAQWQRINELATTRRRRGDDEATTTEQNNANTGPTPDPNYKREPFATHSGKNIHTVHTIKRLLNKNMPQDNLTRSVARTILQYCVCNTVRCHFLHPMPLHILSVLRGQLFAIVPLCTCVVYSCGSEKHSSK